DVSTGPANLLATIHPLSTVRIQRIVDDPLRPIDLVVVLKAQVAEALGDGGEAGAFGLVPQRVVGVRAVDDAAEERQRRIAVQAVLAEDGLEGAFLSMMAELHAFDVEGNRSFAGGGRHHFVAGDEEELGVRIDEFPDQPGTGDAVHLDAFAGDPFHDALLSGIGASPGPQRACTRNPATPTAKAT